MQVEPQDIEAFEKRKPAINVIITGPQDAGKTTLMGHFCFKMGLFSEKTFEKNTKDSAEMGKDSFKYAWFLDKERCERERETTYMNHQQKVELDNSIVCLIDTPGVKNMVKQRVRGVCYGDVAILVVKAGDWVSEKLSRHYYNIITDQH